MVFEPDGFPLNNQVIPTAVRPFYRAAVIPELKKRFRGFRPRGLQLPEPLDSGAQLPSRPAERRGLLPLDLDLDREGLVDYVHG